MSSGYGGRAGEGITNNSKKNKLNGDEKKEDRLLKPVETGIGDFRIVSHIFKQIYAIFVDFSYEFTEDHDS
ncbi:unnamed protein product [Arabidopsis lyrata]|nr:unnamed protein product [Arabidopsis lyrata]